MPAVNFYISPESNLYSNLSKEPLSKLPKTLDSKKTTSPLKTPQTLSAPSSLLPFDALYPKAISSKTVSNDEKPIVQKIGPEIVDMKKTDSDDDSDEGADSDNLLDKKAKKKGKKGAKSKSKKSISKSKSKNSKTTDGDGHVLKGKEHLLDKDQDDDRDGLFGSYRSRRAGRYGAGAGEMEEGKGTLYHTTEQRISTTTEELEGGGKRTIVRFPIKFYFPFPRSGFVFWGRCNCLLAETADANGLLMGSGCVPSAISPS